MDAEVAHRPGEDPRTCEAYTPMGYPLHPFTAHFPIALLLTASALELLALRRGDDGQQIVQLLLRIGWWAALITLGTGTIDLARQLGRVQEALGWVNAHVAASLGILFVYGRLSFRRRLDRTTRLRLHLLGSALVIATGLIGGHLVYSLNFAR